jgi:nucleoid-associated protein YgaU
LRSAVREARLRLECERAAERARSLRMRGLRYTLEGDRVVLEGEALTPEGIDSVVKLFQATSAREVVSRIRHAPPDPARPQALYAGHGYVDVVELGPNAARLAETLTWEVAPGDTLESIAEAVYGDKGKVGPIVNANRSQVGPDGHIHPGMRLRIPPP